MGALIVWLVVLSSVLSGEAVGIAVGLIILLLFNGMDALLTLHMAKMGYTLEKNRGLRKNSVNAVEAIGI